MTDRKNKEEQKRIKRRCSEQNRRDKEKYYYRSLFQLIDSVELVKDFSTVNKIRLLEKVINFAQQTGENLSLEPNFNHLIQQTLKVFSIVIECETGNIISVSDTIREVLNYEKIDWINRDIFSFVYASCLKKFSNELNSNNEFKSEIIDFQTGKLKRKNQENNSIINKKAFLCRLKSNIENEDYIQVNINGYIEISSFGKRLFHATIRKQIENHS